jgi:GxxExxY protein
MHRQHVDLPHADITERIISAFYEVYRELGYGFSEAVYRRALAIVLRQYGLDVTEERMISVMFRAARLSASFTRTWSLLASFW